MANKACFTVYQSLIFYSITVPGPVRELYVDETSKHSVVLKWLPPDEPNGILVGYDIGYQQSKFHSCFRVLLKCNHYK